MTGVYIHIPFCNRKCLYCDFNSYANAYELEDAYVDALIFEMRHFRGTHIDTLYIGGGTPSGLKDENLERILSACKESFQLTEDAEIAVEVNPASAVLSTLSVLKENGVNRLSIGVQSLRDDELSALGRLHNSQEARKTYQTAREIGFTNINLDVMLAIPHQTQSTLKETLQELISMHPEHISAYSLIIEPGTPFAVSVSHLADEEEERRMYWMTNDMLENAGYRCYEISNFSLPGKESRHNLKYWNGESYIGLGAGAASYVHSVRSTHVTGIAEYIQDPFAKYDVSYVSPEERLKEHFWLGLRQRNGVVYHGEFPDAVKRLMEKGLLEQAGNRIRLTHTGTDLANQVFMEFV